MPVLAARRVLEDCRYVLSKLESNQSEQSWRVNWVAAVTLLRAVGHVLDKVDCANSPVLKKVCRDRFKLWNSDDPQHQIFRHFIDCERNNVVKEYSFGYLDDEAATVTISIKGVVTETFQLTPDLYRPLVRGSFSTSDARDVYEDAIDWWEGELRTIEASAH